MNCGDPCDPLTGDRALHPIQHCSYMQSPVLNLMIGWVACSEKILRPYLQSPMYIVRNMRRCTFQDHFLLADFIDAKSQLDTRPFGTGCSLKTIEGLEWNALKGPPGQI
jgi:hypothetical protein